MNKIETIDWRRSINYLIEFQERIGLLRDIDLIIFLISEQIPQMIPLDAFAIALVDIETGEFTLVTAQPKNSLELFQKEMDNQIEQGLFAWTIGERKHIIIPSTVFKNKNLLMVPLGTSRRVLGMIFIITTLQGENVPFQYLWGFNLMVVQASLALENALLYNELDKERKKVEAKAETLEETYRATIESITDGILVVGTDNRVIFANPVCAELIGIPEDTIIGNYLIDIIKDIPLIGLFKKNLAKGKYYSEEISIIDRKTRTQKILDVRASPVITREEKTLGTVIVIRDITKEKEIDRMKTEFVSNVSHELRTPLASIKGFVSTLLDIEVSEDERKEFLTIINEEADRLTQLIEDLLDIARIETGKIRINLQPIYISEIINRVEIELHEKYTKKGISLKIEIDNSLPRVMADKNALIQIFLNLVGNAIKFTKEGGKIFIKTEPYNGGKYLKIKVQDTGIGIEEKHLDKIFDKFYRVETQVHETPGTGLGLAIVKELVEKHNGKIWVESKVGVGSTFYFTIPAETQGGKNGTYINSRR